MLDTETLKYVTPTLVAVIGWFVAHQFNVHRDRQNKRHDLRVQFLLDAYRRLESAANRPKKTEEQTLAFESAVADIQLLGTAEQVAATVRYLRKHASGDGAQIDEVLRLLRNDLRKEVGLSEKIENALVFRFTRQPYHDHLVTGCCSTGSSTLSIFEHQPTSSNPSYTQLKKMADDSSRF